MPMLSYMSEKLTAALRSQQAAYAELGVLRKLVPAPYAETPQDVASAEPTISHAMWSLKHGFRQTLVGWCELHGWLHLLDEGREEKLLDQLLAMNADEFKAWLDRFLSESELAMHKWKD